MGFLGYEISYYQNFSTCLNVEYQLLNFELLYYLGKSYYYIKVMLISK